MRPLVLRLALVKLLVYVEPKKLLQLAALIRQQHADAADKQLRVWETIVLPNDLPSKNAWALTAVAHFILLLHTTLEVLPVVDGTNAKLKPLL